MKRLLLAFSLLASPAWADRLFTSGFESNNILGTEWNSSGGTPTFDTGTVRTGTYSMQANAIANDDWIQRTIPTTSADAGDTLFIRFYVNMSTMPVTAGVIYQNESSTSVITAQVRIVDVTTNKRFQIRNAIAATTQNCSDNLSTGTWYRVELEHVLSDTAGSMRLRTYDGDSSTALCDVTNASTDALGGTNCTAHKFGQDNTTDTLTGYFDDVAINNAVGTFQTGLPGEGHVCFVEPGSEDTIGWTPNTGTDNSANVADLPGATDGDTTYNEVTAGLEATDRLNLATLPACIDAAADMVLAHVVGWARGTSSSGTNTARLKAWDDGGTALNGPTVSTWCDNTAYPAAAFAADSLLVVDIGTDNKTAFGSYDIGYETVSLAQTCRFTGLWANVEWKTAAAVAEDRNRTLLGVGR